MERSKKLIIFSTTCILLHSHAICMKRFLGCVVARKKLEEKTTQTRNFLDPLEEQINMLKERTERLENLYIHQRNEHVQLTKNYQSLNKNLVLMENKYYETCKNYEDRIVEYEDRIIGYEKEIEILTAEKNNMGLRLKIANRDLKRK